MSDLEQKVRQLVSSYVAGLVPLRAFNLELTSLTWDMPEGDDAYRLTYATELLLAECTSDHRPEDSLRLELGTLLGGVLDLIISAGGPTMRVSSPQAADLRAMPTTRHAQPMRVTTLAWNDVQREAVPA